MTRRASGQSGFTLIELMIVVAILSVLSASAIPNLQRAVSRGRYARMIEDCRSIANAATLSYTIHNMTWPNDVNQDTLPPEMADQLAHWPKPPCPGWTYDWDNGSTIKFVTIRRPDTTWVWVYAVDGPSGTSDIRNSPTQRVTCTE